MYHGTRFQLTADVPQALKLVYLLVTVGPSETIIPKTKEICLLSPVALKRFENRGELYTMLTLGPFGCLSARGHTSLFSLAVTRETFRTSLPRTPLAHYSQDSKLFSQRQRKIFQFFEIFKAGSALDKPRAKIHPIIFRNPRRGRSHETCGASSSLSVSKRTRTHTHTPLARGSVHPHARRLHLRTAREEPRGA